MGSNRIKAIFFDVADVLAVESFTLGIRQYEYLHHIPSGQLYAAIHDHSYWKDFSFGRISESEYLRSVQANFSETLDLAELKELILSGLVPNNELIEFLRPLAARYTLGIISNNPREWFDYFYDQNGLKEIFSVKAVSGYLGVRKPDRAIFSRAVQMAEVTPAESIYVDDREEMTAEAAQLGIRIIIYKGLEDFKLNFKRFNII
ncbi:MAG: HAD-IA family hydrolase [Patescibacteria group bacterium]